MTLKKTILAAYEHQDYPFARLLSFSYGQKALGSYPLITTVFNLDLLHLGPKPLLAAKRVLADPSQLCPR